MTEIPKEIEMFGVKCKLIKSSKNYIWQGQDNQYPLLSVSIWPPTNTDKYTTSFLVQIEWFGQPSHNRIFLIGRGKSLEEAEKEIREQFKGCFHGIKSVAERFI